MKIELESKEDRDVVFSDLAQGEACLMHGRLDAIFVKVGDVTATMFSDGSNSGEPVNVDNPGYETVQPMKLLGIRARPK